MHSLVFSTWYQSVTVSLRIVLVTLRGRSPARCTALCAGLLSALRSIRSSRLHKVRAGDLISVYEQTRS